MTDEYFWEDIESAVATCASDGRLSETEAATLYLAIDNRQKRDADVRTLDEYADATGFMPSAPYRVGSTWYLRLPKRAQDRPGTRDVFAEGSTPDEARAKAAAWVREQKRE